MKLWKNLIFVINNFELIDIYMYLVNDVVGIILIKYFKFILLKFWIMKFEYKS